MKKVLFIIIFFIGCNNSLDENTKNKNHLPFWEMRFFVNQFKEPTNVGYITNTSPIIGTFHKKNDHPQTLKAKIMIKENAIGIKLYENDNKQSVKATMQESIDYKINIKHNGKDIDFKFRGIHENDVVIISDIISTTHQKTLINLFKLGGKYHFYFESSNKKIYEFEINDPAKNDFSTLYSNLKNHE